MDYTYLAEELLLAIFAIPRAKTERLAENKVKGQGFVLSYLATVKNRVYPKTLSDSMMVSTARIAVILNQLEEDGLIRRTPDAEDKRQVIVTLTEKGRKLAVKYHTETLESLKKLLEYLGPEDALNYVRIQKKLLQMNSDK